jgi:hypothetical protein
MLYDNRINSQSFFRKKDWQLVGGYSSDLIYDLEDWDFWLLIIELGRDIVKIPERLVYYRTYKNKSESRSGRRKKNRMQTLESLATIFRRHKKLYAAWPEAWKYFSKIEKKFQNENIIIRLIKTIHYRFKQLFLWN